MLRQLFQGHLFDVFLGAPAEQSDIVDDRLFHKALFHKVRIAGVAVALGKFVPFVLHNGGQVNIYGTFPAERVVHQIIFRGRGKIFAAADHVRDGHQVIVHHISKVIRRHSVALDQNAVFHVFKVHGNIPVHEIVIAARAVFGNVLADHVRHAACEFFLNLFFGKVQTVLVVTAVSVFVAQGFNPFLVAETVVRPAEFNEFFRIFGIDILSLALHVRPVIPAHVRPFVVHNAGIFQGIVNDFHAAFHIALQIGVLDPQNKVAAALFGVQITVKGGSQPADMKIARRTGRKSRSYFFCHDFSFYRCLISSSLSL